MDLSENLADRLDELAGLLLTRDNLDGTLQLVADTAVQTIPACDAAGVSLAENERAFTAAASSELVRIVDKHQYETGQGPCLDTVRHGVAHRSPSLEVEIRWPAFCPRALADGVVSCLAIPLAVGDGTAGALNLYSQQEPFGQVHEDLGRGFAVPASVAVANARAYSKSQEMIHHLEEALQSRDVIGQAKGIIMERDGSGSDEAFERLRKLSQHSNVKLRDIAQQMVDDANSRPES